MTARRPAITLALATATALVGTTPAPAGADEPTDPAGQYCWTEAITVEEAQAGVYSVVECVDSYEEMPQARGAAPLAILYDVSSSFGPALQINGPTCTGRSVNFGPSDPWRNIISATDLVACGNAKHWSGQYLSGTHELKSGSVYHTFSGTMNNNTESIEYAP